MENLIIFVIFIIVSVIRSLGSRGQAPMARPMPPVMPRGATSVRPQQAPKQKKVAVPRYSEHELDLLASSHRSVTELPAKKESSPNRDKGITQPKIFQSTETKIPQEEKTRQNPLVAGIIYSEILGAPRARKPWSPRH